MRFFIIFLLFYFMGLSGCDNGGGQDLFVVQDQANATSTTNSTTPPPSGGSTGSPAALSFNPPSPLSVAAAGSDVIIQAIGTPPGGFLSISNINTGGTGGSFNLGPQTDEFTFAASIVTANGTASCAVTYVPPAPFTPVTQIYVVNVTAPTLITFSPPSPQTVTAGDPDLVITATGTPAGGTFSFTVLSTVGPGGTFVPGPAGNQFTFTSSTTTSTGTAVCAVTYTPLAPNVPLTVNYTVNVDVVTVPCPSIPYPTGTLLVTSTGISGDGVNGGGSLCSLYSVDITTGVATLVGPTGFGFISAMEIDVASCTLIARSGVGFTNTLISIDPSTGAGTAIGTTGPFTDLAYDATSISPLTGTAPTMWAAYDPGDGFGVVDPATGAESLIGATGFSCCGNAVAVDPSTGIIYYSVGLGFGSGPANLLTISPATGDGTTLFGSLTGYTGIKFRAMDFNPVDGLLYGIGSTGPASADIWEIDVSAGTATFVSSITVGNVDAMTFVK